jgi:uncharacterized membrane protein YciS (DUF1049 family)
MGPIDFLLNTGPSSNQVVQAPAFSLTKVMAVAAPVLTAACTYAVSTLNDVEFTSGQAMTLIVAIIAFLAVTIAADVLARGMATSADKSASAARESAQAAAEAATKAAELKASSIASGVSGRLRMLRFSQPIDAYVAKDGPDEHVTLLAASDADPPEYLCMHDDRSMTWTPAGVVRMNGHG